MLIASSRHAARARTEVYREHDPIGERFSAFVFVFLDRMKNRLFEPVLANFVLNLYCFNQEISVLFLAVKYFFKASLSLIVSIACLD